MRITGIDERVKSAIYKDFPELVAKLVACRCLGEVFPSIKSSIYQGYFEDKSMDEVLREIVFYAPFNTSHRENMEGVEFRLYFESFNGSDITYTVEIVIPSYLGDLAMGPDFDSLGTILLEHVTENISEIVPGETVEPIFYSEEFENHCYGYKVMFELR